MTHAEMEGPQIPGDLRQRIQRTVDDMREEGADFQPVGGAAPAAPKPRRWWLGILALLIVAELFVIGVAARMEGDDVVAVMPPSPCERSLRNVEAALEAFRADEGRLPGTLELLVPKHLAAVPKPGGSAIEYDGQGSGYVLRCAGAS